MTVVEEDHQRILINKTCSKQEAFNVFVWDGEWKSLHSSKVESLFAVEDTGNKNQVRAVFTGKTDLNISPVTIPLLAKGTKAFDLGYRIKGETKLLREFNLQF